MRGIEAQISACLSVGWSGLHSSLGPGHT